MIVVLPYCHKDAGMAVKQLRWARRLDNHAPFKCLLVHDKEVCDGDVQAVHEAAANYFDAVEEFVCSVWPGMHKQWPFPQNHQYQETATKMFLLQSREPWFWWEPDATPLRSGWVQAIADEHQRGGKPYTGHIVDMHGHMTGVGVYPWNVPCYSGAAMAATSMPWDVASKREVIPHCHRANHIIQHIWERNGGPVTFADKIEVDAIISPTAVIFHRCKDGSLIDILSGPTLVESVKAAAKEVLNRVALTASGAAAERVTAVITAHARPVGLMRAHASCIAAGFKNVIIAASGISGEMETALKECEKKEGTRVIRFADEKSGDIWAKAVREVKTEYVCILHDDDQYTPGLIAGLSGPIAKGYQLIMWPGHIDTQRQHESLNEIGADSGANRSRLITNHLNHKTRSITPCRGCYPTRIAAEALEEAASKFDQRFYYRDKFLVGNDMLLWLRLANEIPEFYCLDYPGVVLGTADSTTVKDITTNSNKLLEIYGHTREYWDKAPQQRHKGKVVVCGYIPDDNYIGVDRWLENIRKFPPKYQQVYVTDHKGKIAKEVNAEWVTPHPDKDQKLMGSSIRFADMVRASHKAGADYLIVTEPDVRVRIPHWDEAIAEEFWEWPYDAVGGGSPVVWNPFAGHADRVLNIMTWANEYTQKSGMLPAYEITQQVNWPVIYPNGALGIWDVAEFKLLFREAFNNPNGCYKTLYPYDHKIGMEWWGTYEYRITRKVAWLTRAYSGCGDRWYNEAQRINLLTSGKKIAVHQIKNGSL